MKLNKITKYLPKVISILILPALIISLFLTGCADNGTDVTTTIIDSTGLIFAQTVATRYPFRKAGSPEESAVGDLIVNELKKMGYTPVIETITGEDFTSRNIVVRISGTGFEIPQSGAISGETLNIRRQVIVGTHYDTPFGTEDVVEYPDYTGIHDNASGVGALISVAKELKNHSLGYDVVLVFFGAGNRDFAGARVFAAQIDEATKDSTDAMYCIDSIYAGDKLYAHAGVNSIALGTKYPRRRKLYEISDVAILNAIDLRFNESDLDVDVNLDGTPDVYREITTNRSDYSVFDEMNIPCVYIESYDYYAPKKEEQTESNNPYFADTLGIIKKTNYDSTAYLTDVLDDNRLETRIKSVAFLIVEALEKGMYK